MCNIQIFKMVHMTSLKTILVMR